VLLTTNADGLRFVKVPCLLFFMCTSHLIDPSLSRFPTLYEEWSVALRSTSLPSVPCMTNWLKAVSKGFPTFQELA
ncbi:hypothetical protein U1Q18_010696, partial [Sarracenia purpurea var. burkii]